MLSQDRQEIIMQYLQTNKSVRIADLSNDLGVTRETIRKDLYEMEQEGIVLKVHGGAILNKANLETKYVTRKTVNEEEKKAIAKKAAELVEDGDTIYIDYGTTALYFSREINNKKDLTIITNSLPIAQELIDYSDFDVIIIGGNVRKNENSLFGPIAYRGIEKLFVDKGFFGIGGLDLQAGYTNMHMGESEVSRLMMKHCQLKIMMADFSKFHSTSMNQVAAIDEVDILITDTTSDAEAVETIKSLQTKVYTVEAEGSHKDE
ncbi:DeoR/GlpR family DNA-binding transcription regulator [Oceanobacillus sp. FSL W7-1293]|uniref:DeoR/GlpR family DNA-binding transcription regulator n=1 Tax=Oceanobacillus sp. FSL W7-1293 TaxID=2921699 RepID=UPI0030CD7425